MIKQQNISSVAQEKQNEVLFSFRIKDVWSKYSDQEQQ